MAWLPTNPDGPKPSVVHTHHHHARSSAKQTRPDSDNQSGPSRRRPRRTRTRTRAGASSLVLTALFALAHPHSAETKAVGRRDETILALCDPDSDDGVPDFLCPSVIAYAASTPTVPTNTFRTHPTSFSFPASLIENPAASAAPGGPSSAPTSISVVSTADLATTTATAETHPAERKRRRKGARLQPRTTAASKPTSSHSKSHRQCTASASAASPSSRRKRVRRRRSLPRPYLPQEELSAPTSITTSSITEHFSSPPSHPSHHNPQDQHQNERLAVEHEGSIASRIVSYSEPGRISKSSGSVTGGSNFSPSLQQQLQAESRRRSGVSSAQHIDADVDNYRAKRQFDVLEISPSSSSTFGISPSPSSSTTTDSDDDGDYGDDDEYGYSYNGWTDADGSIVGLYTSRTIPDRYELGTDGLWHKVCSWTSCTSAACAAESYTGGDDDEDDDDTSNLAASGSILATTATATSSASSGKATTAGGASSSVSASIYSTDDLDLKLPDGWLDAGAKGKNYKEPIIIVSSLLLTMFIACAIGVAIMWKRRRKAARRLLEDVEKKIRRTQSGEESDEEESGVGPPGGNGRRRRGKVETEESSATLAEGKKEGKRGLKGMKSPVEAWKTRARWTWLQKKKGRRRPNNTSCESLGTVRDAPASVVDGEEDESSANASGVEARTGPTRRPRPASRHSTDFVLPNEPRRSVESTRTSLSSPSSTSSARRSTTVTHQTSSATMTSTSSSSTTHSSSDPDPSRIPEPESIPTVQSPAYEECEASAYPIPHHDLPCPVSESCGPPAYRSHSHSRSAPLCLGPGSASGSDSRRRTRRAGSRRTIDGAEAHEVRVRVEEKGREIVADPGDYVMDSSEEDIEERVRDAENAGGEEDWEVENMDEMEARMDRGRESMAQVQMHVATDDKRELARLAERASAPTLHDDSPPALPSVIASNSDPGRCSSTSIPQPHRQDVSASAPDPEALELNICDSLAFSPTHPDDLDSPGAGPGPSSASYTRQAFPLPPPPPSRSQHHTFDLSDLDLEGDFGEMYPYPYGAPPPAFEPSAPPDVSAPEGDPDLDLAASAPTLDFDFDEPPLEEVVCAASAPPPDDFGHLTTPTLTLVEGEASRTGEVGAVSDGEQRVGAVR